MVVWIADRQCRLNDRFRARRQPVAADGMEGVAVDVVAVMAWNHILVRVRGAVLTPGKRTVTQALRVMGLADKLGFARYHEVLNRARWDARDVARRLLLHLPAVLSPGGEVVIGIDDTIGRRWCGRIKARGIYRDSVRSSHGHFVKNSGSLAGRRDAIVSRCEAHVCVLQAVVGLLRAGLRVFAVRDALGSRSLESNDPAIQRIARNGAEIVTAGMVIFEWLGTAEDQCLDAVIRLVK
jgi:hypothetical protein